MSGKATVWRRGKPFPSIRAALADGGDPADPVVVSDGHVESEPIPEAMLMGDTQLLVAFNPEGDRAMFAVECSDEGGL